MKFKKISVKWRVFLFLMAFTAVLIALLWIFQVMSLDRFYQYVKVNEIKSLASSIIKNVNSHDMMRSSPDLQQIINDVSSSNDVSIEIFYGNNVRLYSSEGFRNSLLSLLPIAVKRGLYERALDNNNVFIEYFDQEKISPLRYFAPVHIIIPSDETKATDEPKPFLQKSIIYTQVFTDQHNSQYMLLIDAHISPVFATVRTLRIQILYITAAMILLSVILAFWIARIISKPIIAINNSAKELAEGNYDVHFKGDGYREIAELADTMNYASHELGKVEGFRRELIANISHDLRTPLTLIAGYGEVMRDVPGENNDENAQVIIDEAKRLTGLVNDVLDLSKMQSGSQEVCLCQFNLTDAIQEVVGRFSRFCEQEGYDISFDFDKPAMVTADEKRITQVLYNLLSNAVNYTGADKKVWIHQTITDGRVKVEIVDTGEGIEEENIKYIWDRYYKVDKTHRRAVTGTGLGLSIVKSMLDLHEGAKYGLISEVGKGSTFWFSLYAG